MYQERLFNMPELPEVETIRRQLNEALLGKTVEAVVVLREKSFGGDPNQLKSAVIDGISRKSKVIEFFFKGKGFRHWLGQTT